MSALHRLLQLHTKFWGKAIVDEVRKWHNSHTAVEVDSEEKWVQIAMPSILVSKSSTRSFGSSRLHTGFITIAKSAPLRSNHLAILTLRVCHRVSGERPSTGIGYLKTTRQRMDLWVVDFLPTIQLYPMARAAWCKSNLTVCTYQV
jgi:hypothetical protein